MSVFQPRSLEAVAEKPAVQLMRGAVHRLRMAELQLAEATTLEEIDGGTEAFQRAVAELETVVRLAKLQQGLQVRPAGEAEAMYRQWLVAAGRVAK